jgi:hypothetical protein
MKIEYITRASYVARNKWPNLHEDPALVQDCDETFFTDQTSGSFL